MIVCHCHGKSHREIMDAASSGARCAEDVQQSCAAGGSCGGCIETIKSLLEANARRRHARPLPAEHRTAS